MTGPPLRRYRSRRHPGAKGAPAAYGSLLARPIAATTIPVMIGGLLLVLRQYDPLPFLVWSFPLGLIVASSWAWYRMRSLIVEIVVAENGAAALTVVESLRGDDRGRLQRVFDVREEADAVTLTVGHASYRLDQEDWPELPEMVTALDQAQAYYSRG